MRVLLVIVLALLLAGAASAGSARRAAASPLSLGSLSELSGSVALGGSGPQRLRFLPGKKFAAGVLLQNDSRTPVFLSRADVVEPPLTLIHQIGVRFHAFRYAGCSGGASCPAPTFDIGVGKVREPRAFTVAPGKQVGVELDFRLGSCADVPKANPATISQLRVTFRDKGGSTRQHVLALGYHAMRLRMPKPEDCAQPRSTLSVNDPSHIGTSYLFTIPGSTGDVCTKTERGLAFRSRAMKNDDSRPERLEITFRSFAGVGVYHDVAAAAVVGTRALFHTAVVADVTKATSHEVFANVRGDKLRPEPGTVPYRIYGWMRCRVSG